MSQVREKKVSEAKKQICFAPRQRFLLFKIATTPMDDETHERERERAREENRHVNAITFHDKEIFHDNQGM
jgi:hypothetical protein